ncbi:interaptin isoform X1 [Drosophila eugracilis]|uniref:interaptin isoform X1 n=1 Tax=Drosophila eugracilis TaxID=29029 RepID=UPI001BDB5587|nr:interaptin isoform X1 [Drosophila eugracilis]
MLLLGICFLWSVSPLLLRAYPVESEINSKEPNVLTAQLSDPADYPDLTNGLTDAEVQESLQDLTLEDLNSLNKLLDEHMSRDEDADSDASLKAQSRHAKAAKSKQKPQPLNVALDDGCRDEEDSDDTKPSQCSKRPTCPTTTKRCPKKTTCSPKTTRICTNRPIDNCKPKSGGYMDDDLIIATTKCPKPKNKKCKKAKNDFECEDDDFLCHASRGSRGKEGMSNLQEEEVNPPAEYVPGRELAGIEQLGDEIIPEFNDKGELLDESLNFEEINVDQPAQLDKENSNIENKVNIGLVNQDNMEQALQSDLVKNSKVSLEQTQSNFKKDFRADIKDMEHEGQKNLKQEDQVSFKQEAKTNSDLNNNEMMKQDQVSKLKEENQANFDLDYQADFEQEHNANLEIRNQGNFNREHQLNLDQEEKPYIKLASPSNYQEEHSANGDLQNQYTYRHLNSEKGHQLNFDDEYQTNMYQGEQKICQEQKKSNIERFQQPGNEPVVEEADSPYPYERHELSSISHRKREQAEAEKLLEKQMQGIDNRKQTITRDELLPLDADPAKPETFFDTDSFIANSARDPPRYLIQMQNDFIQSTNDHGERRLREDRSQSEKLNLDKLTEGNNSPMEDLNLESKYRRNKRDNKETDDAPENSKETYIKKLMDSFPRDQGGQINANAALRGFNLGHLRIKRS